MNKVREILNDDEAVLVFDIDGVLAIMEWGEYNHYGENDKEWNDMYEEGTCLYTEEYVSEKMKKFLDSKDKNRVYVVTKTYNEYEFEDKKTFVNKYYGIPKDHVYNVRSNFHKTAVIIKIKEMYPDLPNRKMVMIDDTVEVLNDIMERTDFTTVHISSFIDM